MFIVLLFIVNKFICYELIVCGREECCNVLFFFLNFRDYSNDKVNLVNRKRI